MFDMLESHYMSVWRIAIDLATVGSLNYSHIGCFADVKWLWIGEWEFIDCFEYLGLHMNFYIGMILQFVYKIRVWSEVSCLRLTWLALVVNKKWRASDRVRNSGAQGTNLNSTKLGWNQNLFKKF